jgi:hypothetical protein
VFIVGGIVSLVVNWDAVSAAWNRVKEVRFSSPTVGALALTAGIIILVVLGRFAADKMAHMQKRIGEALLGLSLAAVGWIAAGIHLLIFDKIFLRHGRWEPAKQPVTVTLAPTNSPRLIIKADTQEPKSIMRRIREMFTGGPPA